MADVPEEIEDEKVLTISIGATRGGLKTKRAHHAIDIIRNHVSRHMKTTPDNVWVDPYVNQEIWKLGGKTTIPRIRVKARKIKDFDLVEVILPAD
jgi:ribosomal protein L31E